MNDDLQGFWDDCADREYKHFDGEMSVERKGRLVARFREHALEQLPVERIGTTLDWGCGGGLMSRLIVEFSDVILLDISGECLLEAERYVGGDRIIGKILLGDLSDPIDGCLDLLVCYSVIHHFPSLDYWRMVAAVWNGLLPSFLAIQTKVGVTAVADDYWRDYTNGLILSVEDFLGPFTNYEVDYYREVPNGGSVNIGLAVLSRRD